MKNKGSRIADAIISEYKKKKEWKNKIEQEKQRKVNDINGKSKN